jgi:hypothetical protein
VVLWVVVRETHDGRLSALVDVVAEGVSACTLHARQSFFGDLVLAEVPSV